MKLAFLLSFVFYIANCTLSVRTNSHSSPGTEIDLPAKIKVKVIVSGDTDSGLAETLKDKLSDHPKIESVEVISDSADIYNTGDHKNTLVVRFQNKGVGSDKILSFCCAMDSYLITSSRLILFFLIFLNSLVRSSNRINVLS